jgi:hypothetical protein
MFLKRSESVIIKKLRTNIWFILQFCELLYHNKVNKTKKSNIICFYYFSIFLIFNKIIKINYYYYCKMY